MKRDRGLFRRGRATFLGGTRNSHPHHDAHFRGACSTPSWSRHQLEDALNCHKFDGRPLAVQVPGQAMKWRVDERTRHKHEMFSALDLPTRFHSLLRLQITLALQRGRRHHLSFYRFLHVFASAPPSIHFRGIGAVPFV